MSGHVSSAQWKLWRVAGDGTNTWVADTFITDYKAANYDSSLALATDGYPAIALRVFGGSDLNDRTRLLIAGWMHDTSVAGQAVGPGQVLWGGGFYAGSRKFTPAASEAVIPEIPLAGVTWREADDLVVGALNDSGTAADPGAAFFYGANGDNGHRMLVVPTLGYTRLTLQFEHFNPAGGETGRNQYIAVLARTLTRDQLLSVGSNRGHALNQAGLGPSTNGDITAGSPTTFSWNSPRRSVLLTGAVALATTYYIKWNAAGASASSWDNTVTTTTALPGTIWSPEGVRIASLTVDAANNATYGTDFAITAWV